MMVPEAFIGVVFGFWTMNMMAGKTCYVCGGPGTGQGGLAPRDDCPNK